MALLTLPGRRASRLVLAILPLVASTTALGGEPSLFPDRAIAWQEHDDDDVARKPAVTFLHEMPGTLFFRDSVSGEVDRVLAAEGRRPARDVNAMDEVPRSTWFCPRNHLAPMSPAAVAAGPPGTLPPKPPLRILKGKEEGATPGFRVVDANGRKFMLKLDPAGHLGLTTGAEMVGERFFHAAGYNVPGAFLLDLAPEDLVVDPKATYLVFDVEPRPLTEAQVRETLSKAARGAERRVRAVLTPWIQGEILGGFDMLGRREDDPNDRIPHEDRRSLRASWALFAWLGEIDPGAPNTLDTYVKERGRRFVRHYIIDFGATLGSFTTRSDGLHEGTEYVIEVGRTLGSLLSLGLYRRPFEGERAAWERHVGDYAAAGWFPAEGFDPEQYRPRLKVPAHMRRTDRDLYWGAKLVTSFTDAQIAAVVATAGMPTRDAAYVEHALEVRRDIIGRRYLRPMTAVESPAISSDGTQLCFDDLAIARGYADVKEVRYATAIRDGQGRVLATSDVTPAGAHTCVSLGGAGSGDAYRVVALTTSLGAGRNGTRSKAARIHLRWRAEESRFVVVGLERDE